MKPPRNVGTLFTPAMVRAIRDGRKTQTRRLLKVDPSWELRDFAVGSRWAFFAPPTYQATQHVVPVRWAVGDTLLVREAFAPLAGGGYVFRADMTDEEATTRKWKPGIHMPTVAVRFRLPVTEVRVQRLSAIDEADALAEGFAPEGVRGSVNERSARDAFLRTIRELRGDAAVDDDAWFAAITFRRAEP